MSFMSGAGGASAAGATPAYMSQDIGFGPGMVGPDMPQYSLPAGASFSADSIPLTSSGSNDIGFGKGNLTPDGWKGYESGGTDWKSLVDKAGGALAGAAGKGGGGASASAGAGSMPQAGQSSSSAGRGGGSNLFNEVVAQMMKRQQAYAQNTDPLKATTVDPQRRRGLLGM